MTEFTSELVVWLVLGLLSMNLAANMGVISSRINLQSQLQVLARYVADNANIVGSRMVEVSIRLPDSLDGHIYAVRAGTYTILAESEGLRATQNTRYLMSEQTLDPGRSYSIRAGDTITFRVVGA